MTRGLRHVANTLNNLPTGLNVFAFYFKLKYEKLHSRHPGRAVFSLRSENNTRDRPSPEILVCRRKTFKRLRDEAGTGRLDEADKSVAGSRIRLSESPIGMFVVQVRGSVGDCALPALNISNSRHELSFEWRDLFNRFFGERKVVTTVLHGAPVPSPSRYHVPAQQGSASSTTLTNRLSPSLHALAQLDCHTNHRHMQVSHEGNARIRRLSNPIQAWTDMMEGEFGQAKATIRRCQLRIQADQEIDLDDEGAINKVRLDWERESFQAAASKWTAEWYPLTLACDTCRTLNRQCERGDGGIFIACNYCVETGSPCNYSLATLNRSRPRNLSPDYDLQLMLLEQQNQRGPFAAGNHALQDYQMQLMLHEHQKRKRLLCRSLWGNF